ncbi:glycosyltransferase family 39 protein [Ephemerocybe angulata]|uniref:Dolichyl-phosphate-mannose--protein mannosyltransferase n=1 Tax=Ephemerocybe angulata TaxID=980116 RepID=A0A8H6HPV7_9AGAR|nr:glycosyltransferase family 39 protein [Tulosesus angulatus]
MPAEVEKLREGQFKPFEQVTLEPYERDHAMDGGTIRLSHVPTGRNMHSHTVTAPLSKLNYEVSGYGNLSVGDNHYYWQVEIVDDTKRGSVGQVHSLTTRMRIKHGALGCYMGAANAVLPQWGLKQIEVSCDKENNKKDAHTGLAVPAGDMKLYKSPFLRDFWHLNVAMMTSNNALIPDPDKEDILASKPFDSRLAFPPSRLEDVTISLGVALLTFAVYILRRQRKDNDMDAREWDHFLYVGKIAFFGWGWAFHYVPFLIMGRFAVLMFGHVLDHFIFSSRCFSTRTKAIVFGVLPSILVATFWWFSGVAFVIDGLVNEHWGLKWRKVGWVIYETSLEALYRLASEFKMFMPSLDLAFLGSLGGVWESLCPIEDRGAV